MFVFYIFRLVSRRCHTISIINPLLPAPRRTKRGGLQQPAPSLNPTRRLGIEIMKTICTRGSQHVIDNQNDGYVIKWRWLDRLSHFRNSRQARWKYALRLFKLPLTNSTGCMPICEPASPYSLIPPVLVDQSIRLDNITQLLLPHYKIFHVYCD